MNRPHLIRLGSGQSDRPGVPSKGALLDRAKALGLAVPDGCLIRHGSDVPLDGLASRVAQWCAAESITLVAVRSSFSTEDGAERSGAGRYHTVLSVPAQSIPELARALQDVYASCTEKAERDVIIMAMVPAVVAGVAFTQAEYMDDIVNATAGLADGLVRGSEEGTSLELPKLYPGEWRTPDGPGPGAMRRLQRLLRDVRKSIGQDVDVEWADDGRRCYLLQVRPITAPPIRNDVFTVANHKEILPDPPSTLMASLIVDAAPELFAYYRRCDPSLPASRLFVESVHGRPLINLSLLLDMMRHWGMPTSLVIDNIGGATTRPCGVHPLRLLRSVPALWRIARLQRQSVASANAARQWFRQLAASPLPTQPSLVVDLARSVYVRLVQEMTSLTGAISAPLSIVRRSGTLHIHASRHETIGTSMIRALQQAGSNSALRHEWLEQYGHRGVFESDLAMPRYRERPPFLDDERGPVTQRQKPSHTLASLGTALLWRRVRRFMDSREWLRHDAMRAFGALRDRLLAMEQELRQQGRLAEDASVFDWTIDEVRGYDVGTVPNPELLAMRRSERLALSQGPLPDIVRRFDVPHMEEGALCGVVLTPGDVDGLAWVPNSPEDDMPTSLQHETIVLVAPAIEAGWARALARVHAVVVETGGDLSHGSIIVREMGLPGLTNVRGVMQSVQTGQHIRIRGNTVSVRP